MKKNVMMSAVLGAMVVAAGAAKADDAADLAKLQEQVKLQKQELVDLLAKMEQIEKGQKAAKADLKKSDWASKMKINGDFRYRQEWRDDETGLGKSRQRIRARVGLKAKVNDEVKFGMRLATGGKEPTSTNQDLGNTFIDKGFFLDRAYITYSPKAIEGLDITLGKMAKPWYEASDLVFDGDVNPEGIAAQYTCGPVTLAAGNFIVQEEVTDDIRLMMLQAVGKMAPSDDVKVTLGTTYFGVANDQNDTAAFQDGFDIVDGFAVADVKAALPLKVTAHVANNFAADSDSSAFLVGLGTKTGKWKFAYNYRRLEANSVIDGLNDSDFGRGETGWEGSKLTAGYSISKNFSAGAAWFFANKEIDGDGEMDMLQLDLKAKF